jgi:hypothetical protein
VRGRVGPDPPSGRHCDRLDDGHARAFTIGAGYSDDRNPRADPDEPFEYPAHAIQPELDLVGMQGLLPAQPAVQIRKLHVTLSR